MSRVSAAASVLLVLSGCASFVNDPTHPMRIEAARADGSLVVGAECRLMAESGESTAYSGETTQVRRSSADLQVVCRRPGEAEAKGRLVSRVNGGLVGNLFAGGLIGAAVDMGNAKAFSYPTWIRLEFGKALVFDRRLEVDGQVLLGTSPDLAAQRP